MSNKKILDFVAAVATGQTAQAVDFAVDALRERTQAAVTAYGESYRYKVQGAKNDDTSTGN